MAAFTKSSLSPNKLHRAQALIEFSLIVPIMLLLTLGLIDLGRAFVFGVAVQEGTRQAARLGAEANWDSTVTDAAVLGRVVAASNPALTGCNSSTGAQLCNGGNWNISTSVVSAGQAYSTISAARAANALAGAEITVTVSGSVALMPGASTGMFGLQLPQISVRGQTAMVIL